MGTRASPRPLGLPVGVELDGAGLLAYQRTANEHLAFSLTKACPLRCEHCIVATVDPGLLPGVTVRGEQADRWAAEMPALAESGVRRVSFTGGEPLLARDVLDRLSRAAVDAGIEVTVVTAAHWARSERSCARVLDRFGHVTRWHLSTDVFHAAFVPVAAVVRAARQVTDRGGAALVRMTVDKPPTPEQTALAGELAASLPSGVAVDVEPVFAAGRAAGRPTAPVSRRAGGRSVPCISSGPVVHPDGAASPCCGGLTDQPELWPRRVASAEEAPLGELRRAWLAQHPLRLIRAVGFAPMLRWLADAGIASALTADPPDHPCALCVRLWRDADATRVVAAHLADPEVQRKIDDLYDAILADRPQETP